MSVKERLLNFFRRAESASNQGPGKPGHIASNSRVLVAAVTKWLVPSVSALFIGTGYVAIEAQQNMIGIKLDTMGTAEYIVATAGFLRDICTILPDAAGSIFKHGMIGKPQWALIILLLLACSLASVIDTIFNKYRSIVGMLTIVLLALVCATFIVMDAPLSRIEDAVVNSGTSEGSVPIEIRLHEKANDSSKILERFIYQRADSIWKNIVNSRTSVVETSIKSTLQIQGEFVAHAIISILLLILSCQILRRATNTWESVLALLALFYVLTLPYAYGKLIKSTNFEYGQIQSKSVLVDHQSGQLTDGKSLRGIVLSHSPKSFKILYLKTSKTDCSGAGSKKIKFIEVSDSEIIAIKEIYWLDILAWRVMNQQDCQPAEKEIP